MFIPFTDHSAHLCVHYAHYTSSLLQFLLLYCFLLLLPSGIFKLENKFHFSLFQFQRIFTVATAYFRLSKLPADQCAYQPIVHTLCKCVYAMVKTSILQLCPQDIEMKCVHASNGRNMNMLIV